jgi:hypothetical protein
MQLEGLGDIASARIHGPCASKGTCLLLAECNLVSTDSDDNSQPSAAAAACNWAVCYKLVPPWALGNATKAIGYRLSANMRLTGHASGDEQSQLLFYQVL